MRRLRGLVAGILAAVFLTGVLVAIGGSIGPVEFALVLVASAAIGVTAARIAGRERLN